MPLNHAYDLIFLNWKRHSAASISELIILFHSLVVSENLLKEADKTRAVRIIEELKLDSNSEVSFKKPAGDYKVMFDGGEGHSIEVDGKKIVQ